MERKIVKITYLDPYLIERTMKLEEIKKEKMPLLIVVGYVLDENEERIVISGTIYPEEDESKNGYAYPFFIPKCSIINMRELK